MQRLPRRPLRSQRRPSLRLAIDLHPPERNRPARPFKRTQKAQKLALKFVRWQSENHPRRSSGVTIPSPRWGDSNRLGNGERNSSYAKAARPNERGRERVNVARRPDEVLRNLPRGKTLRGHNSRT